MWRVGNIFKCKLCAKWFFYSWVTAAKCLVWSKACRSLHVRPVCGALCKHSRLSAAGISDLTLCVEQLCAQRHILPIITPSVALSVSLSCAARFRLIRAALSAAHRRSQHKCYVPIMRPVKRLQRDDNKEGNEAWIQSNEQREIIITD